MANPTRFTKVGGTVGKNTRTDGFTQVITFPIQEKAAGTYMTGIALPNGAQIIGAYVNARVAEVTNAAATVAIGSDPAGTAVIIAAGTQTSTGISGEPATANLNITGGEELTYTIATGFVEFEGDCCLLVLGTDS